MQLYHYIFLVRDKDCSLYFLQGHPSTSADDPLPRKNLSYFIVQAKCIRLMTVKRICIALIIWYSFTIRVASDQRFHQGEFVGETLIHASLPMHQTLARLGVAVIGLPLVTLYENSKSILHEVESEFRWSPLLRSRYEYLMFWPSIEVSKLLVKLIPGK